MNFSGCFFFSGYTKISNQLLYLLNPLDTKKSLRKNPDFEAISLFRIYSYRIGCKESDVIPIFCRALFEGYLKGLGRN